MVLNALELVPNVLEGLSKLKNQSAFNFCAIPQVIGISIIALVFNNLEVYQRTVKIRQGEAVKLIQTSTNMENVIAIFREYLQVISQKNETTDPNFTKISMAIEKAR
jgi:farnesyl-diphosphate farnesyltransferase